MRTIVFFIVFVLLLNLDFIGKVVASETSVEISNMADNVKSDVSINTNTGENMICINGKCTTSSDEGNLDIEDDNSKVKISNSDRSASISVKPIIEKKIMDKKASMGIKKKEIGQKLDQKHFEIGQIVRNFGRLILSFIF